MPNIDNLIDTTVRRVYKSYESESRRLSNRIGASRIGQECQRRLWYEFRWAQREQFDGRMLRLFERGNWEEIKVYVELLRIACEVAPGPSPVVGKEGMSKEDAFLMLLPWIQSGRPQLEFTYGEHIVAKIDGAVKGLPEAPNTWHMLEIKTHSDKSFKRIKKEGLQAAKPEHYGQCQVGMKLSGLDRCLYWATNKNTEEIHVERIRLDTEYVKRMIERAEMVIGSPTPPAGVSKDMSKVPCKYCPFNNICTDILNQGPLVSCRTCAWSSPVASGGWYCQKHHKPLDKEAQESACADHLFVPELLPGHDPIEGDENRVVYKWLDNSSGYTWSNGRGENDIKSRSLESGFLPF